MTMPASGTITIDDANMEFGRSLTTQIALQDAQVIQLAGPAAGSHGGEISLWDLYGRTWIISYAFTTPGEYSVQVPFSTKAAVTIKGASGGGGSGGGSEGASSGGGGGGGGDGQILSAVLGYAAGAALDIVVGAPGGGGIGSGGDGNVGQPGGQTWINANGNRLITADCGQGGGPGGAGNPAGGVPAPGGYGGAGYPAGQPGQYSNFSFEGTVWGAVTQVTNTFDGLNFNPPANDVPPVDGNGAALLDAGGGGFPGGAGGMGSNGAERFSGGSGSGSPGTTGYAFLQVNNPAMIGGGGPGFGGAVGPSGFPTYTWIINTTDTGSGNTGGGSTTSGHCCYTAGALVLMADGSWKKIEEIQAGDVLMTPTGPEVCKYLYVTCVGESRQMLSFEEDPTMHMVVDHLLWSRQKDEQWWWCGDVAQLLNEVEIGGSVGTKDLFHIHEGEAEFAHIGGFTKRTPVVIDADPDTTLYLPCLNGPPAIINGYVTAAFFNEYTYDYTQMDWDKLQPNFAQYLPELERLKQRMLKERDEYAAELQQAC